MKMKKNLLKGAAVLGLVAVLAAGGTIAYLTDYDSSVNEFTVGKVEIELKEPGWNPDNQTQTQPSQVISKDPKITNTGVNDAFVYLEVSIPTAEVVWADAQGNRQERQEKELFSFTADGSWTRLGTAKVDSSQVYTYAYNQILRAGETTTPLFNNVTFLNVVEGQLDTRQFQIPVRAYAIQTQNTGGDGGTVQEQAAKAYEKYVNQNTDQDGRVTRAAS